MNLTQAERAAMVKDLEGLSRDYGRKSAVELFNVGHTDKYIWLEGMSLNYSALASAMKEGLKFNEVA